MKGIRRFVLAAVAAGSAVLLLASLRAQPNVEPEYVGAIVCAGCHATQAVAWSKSHHAKSMTAPTAGTVLGDFSGADPRFFPAWERLFSFAPKAGTARSENSPSPRHSALRRCSNIS